MKTSRIIVGSCVVLAGIAMWLFIGSRTEQPEKKADSPVRSANLQRRSQKKIESAKEAMREAMGKQASRGPSSTSSKPRRRFSRDSDLFQHLAPADRKLANAVQSALDEEDFSGVAAAAAQSAQSNNPEVRLNAVEALGWFGVQALPELTTFVSDPDDDVAEAAANQWQLAFSMIEDDSSKIAIAETAMRTFTSPETLELVVQEITAQDDQLVVMQSLVDIIEGGTSVGIRIAKEEYENLTGEPWSGFDAAEDWLERNYKGESSDDSEETAP